MPNIISDDALKVLNKVPSIEDSYIIRIVNTIGNIGGSGVLKISNVRESMIGSVRMNTDFDIQRSMPHPI